MRALVLAAALAAFSLQASAKEYETMAHKALQWIGENSDYNVDAPLPAVRYVTQEDFWALFYGRMPKENEAFQTYDGTYFPDTNVMWVLDESRGVPGETEHTIMHELVHYLQYKSGKEFECVGKREEEAYRLSDRYADEVLFDETLVALGGRTLKADPLLLIYITSCRRDFN